MLSLQTCWQGAAFSQTSNHEPPPQEILWASVQRSKKPIGLVLMSQDMLAGVGNIYRAEILYKAGVHPEQPSASIDRPTFELIWWEV